MKVSGKVFVITGAGGGIGGELALALLKRGAKVAALDLRDGGLESLEEKAGKLKANLSIHTIDITDRAAVEALPQTILKIHKTVDGLVNCAGIIQPFLKINDLDYASIERVMNVNFYGTLYMTKAFLPHLLTRPEAHLINVSSMGGFLPVPGQGVYGASKAAVKLLTESLYAELLDTPVHVTGVYPGATATDITGNSHVKAPSIVGSQAAKLAASSLPPEKAATLIVTGIEKGKPQVFTGKDSNFMNRLYRLSPIFATKLIAKQMKSLLGQ